MPRRASNRRRILFFIGIVVAVYQLFLRGEQSSVKNRAILKNSTVYDELSELQVPFLR